MDKQAVFDKVWHAITQQGCAARLPVPGTGNTRCVYLTDDGRKCAVGHLIPDGHPGQRHLGTVYELLLDHRDLRDLIEVDERSDREFLCRLQTAHDSAGIIRAEDFLDDFRLRMRILARAYRLTVHA